MFRLGVAFLTIFIIAAMFGLRGIAEPTNGNNNNPAFSFPDIIHDCIYLGHYRINFWEKTTSSQ